MSISDKINLTLCIFTALLSVLSIIFVVITIRQNQRMLESSTRPYLTIYDNFTNFQSPSYYLVLKNFGQSSATIKNFHYDMDLSDCVIFKNAPPPFMNLENTTLSPGQSLATEIDIRKALGKNKSINFHIEYSSQSGKCYAENVSLNLIARTGNVVSKASTSGKEMRIISYTLQDLVQKLL